MTAEVVAIDGPSASGKSTVARRVAEGLRGLYVDSGALYRAVTWCALEANVAEGDHEGILAVLRAAKFDFRVEGGAVVWTVNGVDPGMALRTERINRRVSEVAATQEVRDQVGAWLRSLARFGPLVMEGRDIGTVVFPDARHKFYLDADPGERARRRHAESVDPSASTDVRKVLDSLATRDRKDRQRAVAPLKVAESAVVIDSTHLPVDQVVARILGLLRATP